MLNDRIKELRKALGLTLEKFGERLGVGKAALSRIENGSNGVTDQMFKSICREFNVNEAWLRAGEGEMFIKQPRNEEIASFINSVQQDSDESFRKRLITILSEMTVDEWKLLENMATRLVREVDGAEPAATVSVEDAEDAYKKSLSNSVPSMDSSASNTTEGTERKTKKA